MEGVLEQVLPQLVGGRLLAMRKEPPSLGLALQSQGLSKLQQGEKGVKTGTGEV